MTDDDCLHSVDSVHADNLGTYQDTQLTAPGPYRSTKGSSKASRRSRVGRTQDDKNALASPQSDDSGSARSAGVAGGNDEIDGPIHCVRPAGGGSLIATGPLSVRKNASS
jgi:hypothetical protein